MRSLIKKFLTFFLVCALIGAWFGFGTTRLFYLLFEVPTAQAAFGLVQSNSVANRNVNSISVSFSAAAANNLLVVFCGIRNNQSITGPSGFTQIQNSAGTPSHASFYKIAAGGETSVSCSWSSNIEAGIIVLEYNGIDTSDPLDTSGTASGSGDTAAECPSVTPSAGNHLYVAGLTFNANSSISSWTNTFSEREDVNTGAGSPGARIHHAAADLFPSTGSQSTTATAGATGAWRCHTIAFNEAAAGTLTVDIVDGASSPVASPGIAMSSVSFDFDFQTTTGTLGTASEKIRVDNGTATAAWSLTMAATSGATAVWDSGGNTYDFNDPTTDAADGPDTDSVGGELTINPAAGQITPEGGCSATGLSLGSSTAYNEGVTDSITLMSANGSAETGCYWDLTGVGLSQDIPASQAIGTYMIDLTLTAS